MAKKKEGGGLPVIMMYDGRRLCSPGTSFAPLGESHGKGTTTTTHDNGRTSQFYERIGLRANSLIITDSTHVHTY